MSENTWKVISGILALVVIALLLNGFGKTTAEVQQQAPTNVDMTVLADDVVIGPANAKVTIIEYSDPSCPYCAAAAGGTEMVTYMKSRSSNYEPAVPGIIKNYVDTGKVRLVFRYYQGHGNGVDAMKILLCANEQNKFWTLHDVFFNNQNLMNSGTIDVAGLKKLAVDNGVDSAKLEACLSSNKYNSKLQNDMSLGQKAGVSGTPAFAINGQLIEGAEPYSTMKKAIDATLK